MSAIHHINSEQTRLLHERLMYPDIGGFSVKAHAAPGEPVGSPPKGAFMVGLPQHGLDHIPGEEATPDDILSFSETRQRPLSRKGNYMGGWLDPDTNEVSLDVSRAIPTQTNPNAYFQAQHLATAGNQKAIGLVDPKGEYLTDWPSTPQERVKIASYQLSQARR